MWLFIKIILSLFLGGIVGAGIAVIIIIIYEKIFK
jgi:hypothetical protein